MYIQDLNFIVSKTKKHLNCYRIWVLSMDREDSGSSKQWQWFKSQSPNIFWGQKKKKKEQEEELQKLMTST